MKKDKVILFAILLCGLLGGGIDAFAKEKLNYPLNGASDVQEYMKSFENFYNTSPEVIISRLLHFVQTHPQSSWADEALLKAGETAEKLGRYEEAARYYQRVAAEYPQAKKSEESFLWRNYISEVEISFINELYQYYEKYPTYSADLAYLKIAKCHSSQNNLDLAIETIAKLTDKYPQGLWEEEDLARITKLEEKRTLPIYTQAWIRPHREAYLFLAKLYQEKRDLDRAIAINTEFLEKFGKLALFWDVKKNLADLYAEKKEFAKATEILEKTLQEIPAQKNLNPRDAARLQKITQEKIKQFKIQ